MTLQLAGFISSARIFSSGMVLFIFTFAQNAQGPAQAGTDGGAASQPAASRPRNPFQPSGSMDLLRSKLKSQGRGEFQHLQSLPQLPEMKLLGIIKMQKKDRPAAMIDVKGVGTYLIHEGDKLGLTLRGQAEATTGDRDIRIVRSGDETSSRPSSASIIKNQVPVALRIDKISSEGVTVEVGTLGEFLIIR